MNNRNKRKLVFILYAIVLAIILASVAYMKSPAAALYILSSLVVIELMLQIFIRNVCVPLGAAVLMKLPAITKEIVNKFVDHGYDPELGWVRKPNTSKKEFGNTYHIDSNGSRVAPHGQGLDAVISTFGDSYTFCREVGDEETWQNHLSKLTRTNVLNYGVGNYGFDQCLLRLKREYAKTPTKIVIISVVPQTLARILSVWKHYNEFGNSLAFKPKFCNKDDKLVLVPNYIDNPEKYYVISEVIDEVNQNDYFYKNKFLHEAYSFPFLFSLFYSPNRFLLILAKLLRKAIDKITTSDSINQAADKLVFNIAKSEGVLQSRYLYENEPEATRLLEMLVDEFVDYSRQNNFLPMVVFLPMKDDIYFIRDRYNYYENFIKRIRTKVLTIDASEKLLGETSLSKNYKTWHYSNLGNKLVSECIYEFMLDNNVLGPVRN